MQKTFKTGVRYGQNWFFCLNLLKPRPPGEVARLCRDGEGYLQKQQASRLAVFVLRLTMPCFLFGILHKENNA